MILRNFLYTRISHTLYKNITDIGWKGRIPHRNGAKYSRKVFHLENIPVTNSTYWIFLIIILATTTTKKSSGPFPSREFPEVIFPIRKISFHLEDSISSSKILILCNNIRDTQSWIYGSSNCFYSYTIHFGSDAYLKFHTSIISNLKQLPMSQRTVLRKKKKTSHHNQNKQQANKQASHSGPDSGNRTLLYLFKAKYFLHQLRIGPNRHNSTSNFIFFTSTVLLLIFSVSNTWEFLISLFQILFTVIFMSYQ